MSSRSFSPSLLFVCFFLFPLFGFDGDMSPRAFFFSSFVQQEKKSAEVGRGEWCCAAAAHEARWVCEGGEGKIGREGEKKVRGAGDGVAK